MFPNLSLLGNHIQVFEPVAVDETNVTWYGTAVVDEGGTVRFFDDIYKLDASLEKVLNQGYPYPAK